VKEAMRKNYLLTILMVVLTFNSVDRSFLGLVLQNIKADLSLSDTQLGFLSGIAFALIYAIMNIPVARWADRGNRVTIITLMTVLSSAAVALCGATSTFLAASADSHWCGGGGRGKRSAGSFSHCRLFHARRTATSHHPLHAR